MKTIRNEQPTLLLKIFNNTEGRRQICSITQYT